MTAAPSALRATVVVGSPRARGRTSTVAIATARAIQSRAGVVEGDVTVIELAEGRLGEFLRPASPSTAQRTFGVWRWLSRSVPPELHPWTPSAFMRSLRSTGNDHCWQPETGDRQ